MSFWMRARCLAGVMRTMRVGCESNTMTSSRSSAASVSAVAFAACLAISRGNPVIEPERSMTSAMATSGSSRRFSASMRTGRMRSTVVWYQPPRPYPLSPPAKRKPPPRSRTYCSMVSCCVSETRSAGTSERTMKS